MLQIESTDEIASKIEMIGTAYCQYAQRVRDHAVDGEIIATYAADNNLDELFAEMNITSKLHRIKLSKLFRYKPTTLGQAMNQWMKQLQAATANNQTISLPP